MHAKELIAQYEKADESRGYHESLRDLTEALTEYFSWVKGKILEIEPRLKEKIDMWSVFSFHQSPDNLFKIECVNVSLREFSFFGIDELRDFFPYCYCEDKILNILYCFLDYQDIKFSWGSIKNIKVLSSRQTFNKAEFVKFLMESETSKHLISLSRTEIN